MGWLSKLSRNAGLMIHNAVDPEGQKKNRKVVSKKVEQKRISPSVTLRKTTIEEVEIQDASGADQNKSEAKGQ